MKNNTLDPNSKFNIYSSFTLSSDDIAVLSLLYAPLIGSESLSLYLSFSSLLERHNLKSETLTHQALFDIYSLTPSSFLKARYKLEAIGLLNVFTNKEEYIYTLSCPLTAKNFIKDATLGLYLYSKVSRDTFDYIYNHFKIEKIEKSNYENITKPFDEVFKSDISGNDIAYDKFKYILGRKPNANIKITHSDFNIDKFIKEINTSFLETGVTENFKKQIINLAFVYGFNEDEMINLFNDSLNRNNIFDYKKLKNKANIYFNYKRNLNAPTLKEVSDVTDNDLINYLENTPISVILEDTIPNYPAKYLDICTEIHATIDLPKGVLNCMILKAIKDKGGDLPSLNYFKKMSETWIKDNIFSTNDAIKYTTTYDNPDSNSGSNSGEPNNGGFTEL